MSEKDQQLIDALTESLTKTFREEAKSFTKDAKEGIGQYKSFLKWFVPVVVIITIAVFGVFATVIGGNREDIHDLQTGLGILDGGAASEHPNQAAFGLSFDKYIKKRGGNQ